MSSTSPRFILASGSPQRKQLLTEAGYRFEVIVPNDSAEDCGICSTGGPAALVTDLALRKAADVASTLASRSKSLSPTLIVACDTVAECAGAVLGKPRDEDHARDMLQRLRGQQQRVFSGVCLWPLGLWQLRPRQMGLRQMGPGQMGLRQVDMTGSIETPQTSLAVTQLRMDAISDSDLEDYLASGLWRGKAGALGYQDRPGWLHLLEGSKSNVIGLPMELLAEQLAQLGLTLD